MSEFAPVRVRTPILAGALWLSGCASAATAPRAPSAERAPPAPTPAADLSEPTAVGAAPTLKVTAAQVDEAEPAGAQALYPEGAVSAEPLDDAFEEPAAAGAAPAASNHPLAGKSEAELALLLAGDPGALGPLSLGTPNAGRLLNGVQLPEDPELYERVDPAHEWGTRETIDYLRHAIRRVHEQFPDTPPLHVGHISDDDGGPLSPHKSHQSGRDVDIGYYYQAGARWYARGTEKNLDLARTWAFVKALVTETDVDLIIIDHSIQKLLRQHAAQVGEDAAWVAQVFEGAPGRRRGVIVHAPGHATHIHIRFFNPVAQETARRIYPQLIEQKLVAPPVYYVHHRVKRGETLGKLARRYGVTVKAIMQANGLRSTLIRAKHVYKIPKAGPVRPNLAPVSIPPRLPPPPAPADS